MIFDTIHISIDPGLDTVKVAYTYVQDGVYHYGNLAGAPYPAWAYYDDLDCTWQYGFDAVKFGSGKSYKNLVKIKSLFMMLQNPKNEYFYRSEHHFPNFYFPNKIEIEDDFSRAVQDEHTFEAEQTPREVCLGFFRALFSTYILPALDRIECFEKATTQIIPSVIYPAIASADSIIELKSLIYQTASAFANEYRMVLDTATCLVNGLLATKATAIYAYKTGAICSGDIAMIFNIGETDISVSKVSIDRIDNNFICLNVDGADGHLPPEGVGGNDIDELIKHLLDEKLDARVPLGQSQAAHINESGTYKQQYNLMRTIKKTKEYFSEEYYPVHFSEGVPFSIMRDLVYDILLTREEFYAGMTEGTYAVANRIAAYVTNEIRSDDAHPERAHINKVLFVGGAIETYGLKDHIINTARASITRPISWVNLDTTQDVDSTIATRENEVYSAAAGGALFSAGFVTLKTLLRKYYGTWMTHGNDRTKTKYFAAFRYKNGAVGGMCPGEVIPAGGARYHTQEFALGSNSTIRDELYSVDTLPASGEMQIGNAGGSLRGTAEHLFGLRVLCHGKLTNNAQRQIVCIEGVDVDEDGRAKPFLTTKNPHDSVFVKFEFDSDLSLIG